MLFAILPPDASYATSLLPALSVLGLGLAVTVAPLTATVLNAVDREEQGAASGINNAVARVAALLAIAVFGIVAAAAFNRSLDSRLAASVSPATRRLLEPERARLGAMKPPSPRSTESLALSAVFSSVSRFFRRISVEFPSKIWISSDQPEARTPSSASEDLVVVPRKLGGVGVVGRDTR